MKSDVTDGLAPTRESRVTATIPAGNHWVDLVSPVRIDFGVPQDASGAIPHGVVRGITAGLGDGYSVDTPELLIRSASRSRAPDVNWVDYAMPPRRNPGLDISSHVEAPAVETSHPDITYCVEQISVRLHDVGVAVISLRLSVALRSAVPICEFRQIAEATANSDLVRYAEQWLADVLNRLKTQLAPVTHNSAFERFPANRLAGFHRLYVFDSPFAPEQADSIGALVSASSTQHPENSSTERDRFCFVGNGSSMLWGTDANPDDTASPLAIIRYYQYYYFGLLLIDEALHHAMAIYTSLTSDRAAARSSQVAVESLGDAAQSFQFAHRDDLSTLPPQHAAFWKQMVAQWETLEIAQSVQRKIEALDSLSQRISRSVANQLARRTGLIVTAFTCLTLVTLLLDAVSFTSTTDSITVSLNRIVVVIVGLIISIAAFLGIRATSNHQSHHL